MTKHLIRLALASVFLLMTACQMTAAKKSDAQWTGETLTVSTGKVERTWKWTGKGLVTTSIKNLKTNKVWSDQTNQVCDWMIKGLIDENTVAKIIDVKQEISNDEGFTNDHLQVTAHILYPDSKIELKYTIWAYDNAPGLRTVVSIKALQGFDAQKFKKKKIADRADFLPVATTGKNVEAIGYYSDTQNRNRLDTPILKEQIISDQGSNNWASILTIRDGAEAISNVKESHKCINTPHAGANTGGFNFGANGIDNTGLGLVPSEFVTDRFRNCWAAWTIVADGTKDQQSLTFKQFDRMRYPIDPKRDIYLMANTWGTTTTPQEARYAAREKNIFAEIKSQADLGLDIQQIDDGWQGTHFRGVDKWRPVKEGKYMGPNVKEIKKTEMYDIYPEGWTNVKKAAKDAGIRLGLWCAWWIPEEDLIWNYDHGGFKSYKLDFASLTTMTKYEHLMGKARNLIKHSNHQTRINWDVTEKEARVGYFSGREYGNIYLENRKPTRPASVVYKPYLVLRDAWHIAKHVNLNKFQITVQNVDRINRKVSDAWKHRHDYALAQTLMGCPIFFQETHYYTEAARQQLKPLINTYKSVRDDMFKGYVFAIADEPDNKSWSGFQNHNPETGEGFITILRQIENNASNKSIKLKFLAGKTISITNLMNNSESTVVVPQDGSVDFSIAEAGNFLFLKYK